MTNEEQVERWNGDSGERWVSHQELIDRAIEPFGERALERLGVRRGAHVIEVGCGTGTTVLALAEAVGPPGHVLGLDVSEPMLARARERTAHLSNAELLCADASGHGFSAEFDALFSRFGVMFFDRPAHAFSNLRTGLRPGAPLTFVCWQALEQNDWVWKPLQVMLPLLDERPPAPEARAPGPFAFADSDYLRDQLLAAGYVDVEIEDLRAPVTMSCTGVSKAVEFCLRIGPGARVVDTQSPAVQEQIRAGLTGLFAEFEDDGEVALGGAAWLVSARNA
ncbi:MAG: SAM-dependent methyltransferase [Chlamydiales bacterium]|jgi:SAM-dependent methyltransferase